MKYLIIGLFGIFINCLAGNLNAANVEVLNKIFETNPVPFAHDLQLKILPNQKSNAELCLCMHGMGGDSSLCEVMSVNPALPYHILAFNFPDYGLRYRNPNITFGTFEEVAPALYVLKKSVIDGGLNKIHLYGFSAGGGAIVNLLAILNTNQYDIALQKIGIGQAEKQNILQAVQEGSVILEVPLKSFDEVAEVWKRNDLGVLAQRARKNNLVPIENLKNLQGLALNCFVYFANPDKVIGNRDDAEFIMRLQNSNKNGQTVALIGKQSGHTHFHPELWDAYEKFVSSRILSL